MDKEKEAFEKWWCEPQGTSLRAEYLHHPQEAYWIGWQARATLAPVDGDTVCRHCDGVGWYEVCGPNYYTGEAEQQQQQCECTAALAPVDGDASRQEDNVFRQLMLASIRALPQTNVEDFDETRRFLIRNIETCEDAGMRKAFAECLAAMPDRVQPASIEPIDSTPTMEMLSAKMDEWLKQIKQPAGVGELEREDIEALLISYDIAVAVGRPLEAIKPNIEIVRELLTAATEGDVE